MSDNEKTLSYIYNKLVENEDDILGHIAYSVYKRQKIAEIERIRREKGIEYVSASDIEPFIKLAQTDEQIEFYLNKADVLSKTFLSNSVALELENKKRDLEREFIETHKSHGYWYAVGQSIVGSFCFLVIGYLILKTTGSWDKIMNLFG